MTNNAALPNLPCPPEPKPTDPLPVRNPLWPDYANNPPYVQDTAKNHVFISMERKMLTEYQMKQLEEAVACEYLKILGGTWTPCLDTHEVKLGMLHYHPWIRVIP